jgi:hypothetical protein
VSIASVSQKTVGGSVAAGNAISGNDHDGVGAERVA